MAVEGFEADDLIANAVALAQERGAAQVVIVSTDKDLCQLVTEPGLGDGQAARRARTAPPSRPSRPSRPSLSPTSLLLPRQGDASERVQRPEEGDVGRRHGRAEVRRAPFAAGGLPRPHGRQVGQRARSHGGGAQARRGALRTSSAPPLRRLCAASAPPLRRLCAASAASAPPLRPLRAPLRAHPVRPLHPLQTFLQQHGTLEALLAAAPAMKKSKVRDALISYGDSALSQRSKAAVVLGLQSELESRADELVGAVPPPPAERPELREFLQRHEFASLERKLFGRAAR